MPAARGAALAGAYNALAELTPTTAATSSLRRPPTDNADAHRHFPGVRRRGRATSSGPTTRRSTHLERDLRRLNRVNLILEKVPALTDLDDTEKNQILGEAHFLRALH